MPKNRTRQISLDSPKTANRLYCHGCESTLPLTPKRPVTHSVSETSHDGHSVELTFYCAEHFGAWLASSKLTG